ncbi:MAG: DegT/DnrJ/EryC1/StrS family aminotransferase [bacterium]|nr:DegT/DnrJ/EryC1/StrS family aminotransferase [bacterium]
MHENEGRRVDRYDLVTPMLPCKQEILDGVERLLTTGQYILGREVHALEAEMATACGAADAVGVASGSAALYMALQIAGVGPGVEVVTTPYTFVATIEAIIRLGGTPVFVDIDPRTLNLDPDLAADAVTARTRVLLPVHIFGMPCEMEPLERTAARHGLDIVEDMCQAFGSLYRGRPCGSLGRTACLSFYPTKNLPGIGDGGMILCRDAADAALLRRLRGHETVRVGGRLHSGWNSRLDEIQALAIRVRLARFADEQADRDRAAAVYNELVPEAHRLATPRPGSGLRVTHHQYWIRVPERARLEARLREAGVDFGVYYDPPLHRHELAEYCRVHGDLAHAEAAGREVLALPIHQALPERDARRIGELVREHLAGTA